MSFRGAFVHTINESGRISVPAKMRDVLRNEYNEDALVLAEGDAGIVIAYPTVEWAKKERIFAENPPTNKEQADYERRIFATLDDVTIDKQGRILISPTLRDHARLNGECMIVGRMTRFEIWDKAHWDKEIEGTPSDTSLLGAHVNELRL